MTKHASKLMQTLVGRGYLYQCTDEAGLDALAQTEKLVGYIGLIAQRRVCMLALLSKL